MQTEIKHRRPLRPRATATGSPSLEEEKGIVVLNLEQINNAHPYVFRERLDIVDHDHSRLLLRTF